MTMAYDSKIGTHNNNNNNNTFPQDAASSLTSASENNPLSVAALVGYRLDAFLQQQQDDDDDITLSPTKALFAETCSHNNDQDTSVPQRHLYATKREWMRAVIESALDVVAEIEWQEE